MKKLTRLKGMVVACLIVLCGCATTRPYLTDPTYTQPLQKGTVLRQLSIERSLEERILAMNPERVSEQDIREVLSRTTAPRVINIHGGIYPVHLCMESFSQFLIGMGYPENRIRNPRDGSFTVSCYRSSTMIAGSIAWYYEREGLRPMMVGHSQGGMQAVKALYELAGAFNEHVTVWNPLEDEQEPRTSIIDPLTGEERPVVGLQVSYTTAVGSGGFTRFLPNQWVMAGRLRSIPDTTVEFAGFVIGMDLWGGDLLGFGSANHYVANGKAEVRTVRLPLGYNHVTVPVTSHLSEHQEIRDWINCYVPTEEPKLDVEFQGNSANILWAAEVWHGIKKHWVLELQRLIRAKRDLRHGP